MMSSPFSQARIWQYENSLWKMKPGMHQSEMPLNRQAERRSAELVTDKLVARTEILA